MDRYFDALKRNRRRILRLDNVVGVGVGYKQVGTTTTDQPALVVYVKKKHPVKNLVRSHVVPKQLDGLATDVVEIGTVRMLVSRTEKERPCQPGVSIGHYQSTAGTLGAIVKDKATGEMMILSNNHVLANATTDRDTRAKVGDPILQPGPYDGGTLAERIGALEKFVPLQKSEVPAECPVAAGVARGTNLFLQLFRPDYKFHMVKQLAAENVVDCALARPDSSGLVQPAVLEIGEVTGVAEVKPGQKVQKSGRTSGVTKGMVKTVGTTLEVEMKDNETIMFSDQVVADMVSQPGDSGSLVLDEERRAVGLLFAGSDKITVFNRIQNVVEKLDIEF
ncbi:MAG: hypothetical protein C4589_08305 [Peptococcaceae bacterium]|nr:MAG: hypothetical protein C4589_08305 [Peptococcaceae bacterium]